MNIKKDLGQFFTTNVNYILNGFEKYVVNKDILDPFAGNGDLLLWAQNNKAKSIQGLDIDKRLLAANIRFNDSLLSIPYADFNLTNPPYLAKNKMERKLKDKYDLSNYEDFYLLSIKNIINSRPQEGIIIIPVNFFSAENSNHLRKEFLSQYCISFVNYFREQVFEDTTYNVVSFHYYLKNNSSQNVKFRIFPDQKEYQFTLEEKYNYRIAGKEINEILNAPKLRIVRLTEELINKNPGKETIKVFFNDKKSQIDYQINQSFLNQLDQNIILLNCIDTSSHKDGWIKAEDIRSFGKNCLVGKSTSRNIAYVLLPENITIKQQEKIIIFFNDELNRLRNKYQSLFLTNFRDNDRKRISFDFCYKLISYYYERIK